MSRTVAYVREVVPTVGQTELAMNQNITINKLLEFHTYDSMFNNTKIFGQQFNFTDQIYVYYFFYYSCCTSLPVTDIA